MTGADIIFSMGNCILFFFQIVMWVRYHINKEEVQPKKYTRPRKISNFCLAGVFYRKRFCGRVKIAPVPKAQLKKREILSARTKSSREPAWINH